MEVGGYWAWKTLLGCTVPTHESLMMEWIPWFLEIRADFVIAHLNQNGYIVQLMLVTMLSSIPASDLCCMSSLSQFCLFHKCKKESNRKVGSSTHTYISVHVKTTICDCITQKGNQNKVLTLWYFKPFFNLTNTLSLTKDKDTMMRRRKFLQVRERRVWESAFQQRLQKQQGQQAGKQRW